jgi:hypothetical protein
MKLSAIAVGPTFAGGTSIQLQLQGAPDNGSGAPGTYTTMWTSPAFALATLQAGVGLQLCNVDMPRLEPTQPVPRFLQLNFISVGTFTGGLGAIEASIQLDLDQQIMGVTGAYSGYPAGVIVAN